ncbi:UDP-glucose/GDP-mannose dehydrogenase family protein [Yersinia pestis]|nr:MULTISPECIES: UDP-glucose/GDP-mannose dehydrogenase family protein [Yersinia pseudotuberculosis complex]EDR32414.1 UDP-glucose/GDP-mannose dehydrogenase family protein [Yersinia pestis biovar Orientalis str. IP275]ERP72783.1 UDP-glucose 6-dehydrogenase [Yersinia pestis S3]ERP73450.1 UDP-glucose 6-dehydrogenase [Yersinia pestis 24H]CQD48030.1 nucleotide sugar dehydrogenase [Yersinia intermedia]ABG13498.1 putative nucleotide sugar dehydrogenase [Yersinia pestis Antiqua]
MKVTVFGIGYVGLVQATVLAEVGHDVLCIDIDANKVADLKKGRIAIFEPGLAPLVKENYEAGRLQFSTDAQAGVAHGVIQFIAVGTPPDEDGAADLKYVLDVASTIGTYMDSPKVIIDKSTVPVGTADKVHQVIQAILEQRGEKIDFSVVSNPEFLKEGAAVADCKRPERIVIGIDTDDSGALELISELYEPFNRNHDRMLVMDIRSAELTKYAANGMLATKISFMNEIANIAERLGADIEKVRQGIGSDSRIGYHFIYSGCGYGGSCFPKDIQALIRTAEDKGYKPQLLQAVEQINNQQKYKLTEFIKSHFNSQLAGKTFAVWGLAFKPNTDDMREAPSRVVMESLWEAGATIQAYDPEAMDETQRIYGARDDLRLMGTKESALQGADALIICTEWQSFRAPDFDMIKSRLKHPVIFDGRNLYDPERLNSRGFTYYGIGRGVSINLS